MTPEQFREIEADLGLTHVEMADRLGMSVVSVKRMATNAQAITDQTEKQVVALFLIEKEGLKKKYEKLLAKYHHDTIK